MTTELTAPLSEAEITLLRELHRRTSSGYCFGCDPMDGAPIPCLVHRALDELARLRTEVADLHIVANSLLPAKTDLTIDHLLESVRFLRSIPFAGIPARAVSEHVEK
jgi:hypothetical protein